MSKEHCANCLIKEEDGLCLYKNCICASGNRLRIAVKLSHINEMNMICGISKTAKHCFNKSSMADEEKQFFNSKTAILPYLLQMVR